MQTDKKQRIMRATERLFESRRYHEITVSEIAERAGVAKGTVYCYFADKEELFFQTVIAGYDEMCETLREGVPPGTSFRDRLLVACASIRAFVRRRQPLVRMINSEDDRARDAGGRIRERLMAQRKKLIQAMADIISQGAPGEVRRDAPPEALAEYLLGMLRTRARELAGADEAVRSDEFLVDLFLNGAAGPAPLKECEASRQ